MKVNKKLQSEKDDMLSEYDFRSGVRGKYAKRFANGTNLIKIDPSLLSIFPNSESVNLVLHDFVNLLQHFKNASSKMYPEVTNQPKK